MCIFVFKWREAAPTRKSKIFEMGTAHAQKSGARQLAVKGVCFLMQMARSDTNEKIERFSRWAPLIFTFVQINEFVIDKHIPL